MTAILSEAKLPPRVVIESVTAYSEADLAAQLAQMRVPPIMRSLIVTTGYFSYGSEAEERAPQIYLPHPRIDHVEAVFDWGWFQSHVRFPIGQTTLWLFYGLTRGNPLPGLPQPVTRETIWYSSLVFPHRKVLSQWLEMHLKPEHENKYLFAA